MTTVIKFLKEKVLKADSFINFTTLQTCNLADQREAA